MLYNGQCVVISIHRFFLIPVLALTGCSYSARFALVPAIDTTGGVGVTGKVTVATGLTDVDVERKKGPRVGIISLPVAAGLGFRVRSSTESVYEGTVGGEYVEVGRVPGNLGFRGGLLVSGRVIAGSDIRVGGTMQTALMVTFWQGYSRTIDGLPTRPCAAVGPMFEAAVFDDQGNAVGALGLGLTLDWYTLTSWNIR